MTWKVVQRVSVAVMLDGGCCVDDRDGGVRTVWLSVSSNAVINTYDRYTEITFKERTGAAPRTSVTEERNKNDEWTYYYGLGFEWVPVGYSAGDNGWGEEAGDRSVSFSMIWHHCINVAVTSYVDSSSYKFDSEDSQRIDVEVQGYSASLYVKKTRKFDIRGF